VLVAEVFWNAYGEDDKPVSIEHIEAVPDLKAWLDCNRTEDRGVSLPFAGHSRHVDDSQRPHRYIAEVVQGAATVNNNPVSKPPLE
jgi:hypothetical protein